MPLKAISPKLLLTVQQRTRVSHMDRELEMRQDNPFELDRDVQQVEDNNSLYLAAEVYDAEAPLEDADTGVGEPQRLGGALGLELLEDDHHPKQWQRLQPAWRYILPFLVGT